MSRFTPRMHGHSNANGKSGLFAKAADALRAARPSSVPNPSSGLGDDADFEPSGADAGMLDQLLKHAVRLSPVTKRHMFSGFQGAGRGLTLGWAQLPELKGNGFALGVFVSRGEFCQLALADGHGRVFPGVSPKMDIQGMEPVMMFNREGEVMLHDDSRISLATGEEGAGVAGRSRGRALRAVQGAVVANNPTNGMMWLASWLRVGDRYTLEQLRADLPRDMRVDLEYRDAMAIAFFACCMVPQLEGGLVGFGAGNIFRRLNREAPIGAIRRSVQDGVDARAQGLRVSGLEEYFADLMREAGALAVSKGLEAVHGAEPLHLYTSSYSGNYFFSWDDSLELAPALEALRIEGNLNRFSAVSTWLEHNGRIGALPIEDTVSHAEAAQIDHAILVNPALTALKDGDEFPGSLGERSSVSLMRLLKLAGASARDEAGHAAVRLAGSTGEWVYRKTLSKLLRSLRLPYRFDTEFRSNLAAGEVAISFTAAEASMMPVRQYDITTRSWVDVSVQERARMCVQYNLRVGLIIAALCFGVDERVQRVSMRIESLGLEEAVAKQDSAIAKFIAQALDAFERMSGRGMGSARGKADPKDGDVHGDPTHIGVTEAAEGLHTDAVVSSQGAATQSGHDEATQSGNAVGHSESAESEDHDGSPMSGGEADDLNTPAMDSDDEAGVDATFADLMKGIDIDESVIATPDGQSQGRAEGQSGADGASGPNADDNGVQLGGLGVSNESGQGNGPTMKAVATVTFERAGFLERIDSDGLDNPIDTYRAFLAALNLDTDTGFKPVAPQFTLHDKRYSPAASQSEPELEDMVLDATSAQVLGTSNVSGLSIQRADLLQRAVSDFHRLAADAGMPSVDKARRAMGIIDAIGDPELKSLSSSVSSALIDGVDTPDLDFTFTTRIDEQRNRARTMLFSGDFDGAIDSMERMLADVDAIYAKCQGVPRYYNSYAERVVYNRLFATSDERTVLIPDNLFYAHMELADLLAQVRGAQEALPHLNQMVAYAPAYPLSHMRLAVQLARQKDWNSARAACLNALRVSLDRDDAAYAYYRLAYAEWMSDRLDVAAACYIMSEHISPGKIGSLAEEVQELMARAASQCIPVPSSVEEAQRLLASREMPVWPHTEVEPIMAQAAQVCVDNGMFVPARTLAVAVARMSDGSDDGMDMAQVQFLRSLGA